MEDVKNKKYNKLNGGMLDLTQITNVILNLMIVLIDRTNILPIINSYLNISWAIGMNRGVVKLHDWKVFFSEGFPVMTTAKKQNSLAHFS